MSGKAGTGKSHVIKTFQKFLKLFSDGCNIPFDSSITKYTACTGSAACLIPFETTIHLAAELNSRKVRNDSPDWTDVILLVIDEISYMPQKDLVKLDQNLRILSGNKDTIFGGIHIIFAGDFPSYHQ